MEIERSRPIAEIVFPRALSGPTGAKLFSYVWQWEEIADRRVSDWDRSVVNSKTGREIVHQFNVDGEYVSAETAMELLGYTEAFKKVKSTAKTLAKLRMEMRKLEITEQKWHEDWAVVCAIELPTVIVGEWFTEYGTKKRTWKMGEIESDQIWSSNGLQEEDDVLKDLIKHYRSKEMAKLGWGSYSYTIESNAKSRFKYDRLDLLKRIERAESRLQSVTA